MTPRPLFPKARPTKAGRRKKAAPKAKVHPFIWDASSDWRGQPFCKECDQPRSNPVHNLTETPGAATEIDQRKLGESDDRT